MATLGDVARRAGVSAASVSRVLNHPAKVSQEVRDRVMRAMGEFGYVRDGAARAWRQAVGPVMESVRLLQMPAGRLSHTTTLRGRKVPRSRKREHGLAPLSPCGPSLILGVELPLDAFFGSPGVRRAFRRGTNGSNPSPSSTESTTNLTSYARRNSQLWLMNPCREIAFE
jgi:hypothetical protein